MRRVVLSLVSLAALNASSVADDGVLFFRCKSASIRNTAVYTTIDFTHATAKVSMDPADEREWSPAEITDVVVKWQEHYPRSEVSAVFNRYSGSLEYVMKPSNGPLEIVNMDCSRTSPPRRLY
jgi:hypothetical protein